MNVGLYFMAAVGTAEAVDSGLSEDVELCFRLE